MTGPRWPAAARFAWRDLRGGLRGFAILLACVAFGVFAIVAVASVSRGLSDGLSREGRRILGADVAFGLIHRELNPDERAYLESLGDLSTLATMRAMARSPGGSSALVELKAVPDAYPAIGDVGLSPAMRLGDALAQKDGAWGFVAEAELAARLDLRPGDVVEIGDARMVYRAQLVSEPDKLAGGVGFGPRVILSLDAFRAANLARPGSLVRWTNRLVAAGPAGVPAGDAAIAHIVAEARARFPEAGWEVRTRDNVSPQFEKNIERFAQFLALVGLTTLIVGGVGVANAARAFVDRKITDFATFKALGATGRQAFAIALVEILAISAIGVAIGLGLGAAAPFAVAPALEAASKLPFRAAIYPDELAIGAVYGMLTALAFALGPLGRAHDAPVGSLFRGRIEMDRTRLRAGYLLMLAATVAALVGAIVAFSNDRRLALIYVAAAIACLALLRGVAALIMFAARIAPRARRFETRLAIASLHRPGALTPSVVLSLGLGLTLLVTLTLIDGNLRAELEHSVPGETPSFYFLDLRSSEAQAFGDFVKATAPDAKVDSVPMMRGRIARLNGSRPEDIKTGEDAAWALEGDRGITYAASLPEGSALTAGEWWPADYDGPPLVSMEASVAKGLGLKLGDNVTLNVLGRDITAKIANLRTVNWRGLGINFVFVFSPNTFAGAPHTLLATATFPDGGDPAVELGLMKAISANFPSIASVRVKDALDALRDLMGQLTWAIRAASGVALAASMLVLAGAVAAGRNVRLYESVMLKTLGATRGRLLWAMILEYGLLGLVTGLFGVAAGTLAAWGIVVRLMRLDDFIPQWPAAFEAVAIALALTVGVGLAGAWSVLGRKPAAYLREL